jgi:hypothetical protein
VVRKGLAIIVVCSTMSVARADDAVHATTEAPPSRHLVYGELFGKAGAYGLGYELTIAPRLALGGVASFVSVRGQQIATLSPYVHATLIKRGKHALFGELGAVLVHSRIPSPVDDWNGMSESGGGGVAAVGWERASRHLVVRAQGSVLVGEGGAAPWGGLAIGVRP